MPAPPPGYFLHRLGTGLSPPPVHPTRIATPIQAKIPVGGIDDPLEREADRIADEVMGESAFPATSAVPRRIQRFSKLSNTTHIAAGNVERVLARSGTPLDSALRRDMELRFRHDFGGVRVHVDTEAADSVRAVRARAYTVGKDLVFGAGNYAPSTEAGKRLLAHELTHVVQQTSECSARTLQRDAIDDLAATIARDLDNYVAKNAAPYDQINDVFRHLDSDIEDNVAAAFTELLDDASLERFAADPAGLATLDMLSEAILTGSVSLFESKQGERILIAKRKQLSPEKYAAEAERIAELRHRAEGSPLMLSDDQKAARIAEDLKPYAAAHLYAHIIEVFDDLSSDIEDNVAAEFVAAQSDAMLEEFSASGGNAMLDVLYEAMITGHVTAFESLQAERVLLAKAKPKRPGEAQPIPADSYMEQAERIARLRDRAEDTSLPDLANDMRATAIAHELNAAAAQRQYRQIIAKMRDLSADIEDNVASHFTELQPPAKLDEFAADPDGRAMLNVLYAATITGSVTDFERLQTDRILQAKAKVAPKPQVAASEYVAKRGYQPVYVFPVRMQKTFRSSYAVPNAELQPNGKVKVSYDDEIHFWDADMFKEDMQHIPPYRELSSGIELDPDELIFVKLYDQDEKIVPVPALALIDYSNQTRRHSVNVGVSAFETGLFVGLGGPEAFSGARLEALAAEVEAGEASAAAYNLQRAALWTDRAAIVLPVVTMLVDENRDWILKTFPNAGPVLLAVLDKANKLSEYYGWARMGIDGAQYLKSQLGPAMAEWRAEAAAARDLTSSQRRTIEDIDRTLSDMQASLDATEAKAAADMAKRVDEDPNIAISGDEGHRTAKVDGHEVTEEVDAATGVVHCAVHSDGGVPVDCPERLLGHQPAAEPAAETEQSPQQGRKPPTRVPGSQLSEREQQRLEALTRRRQELLEQRAAISDDLRNDAESLKQANRQPASRRDQAVAEARQELQRDKTHQLNNEAALERNAEDIQSASKSFAQKVSAEVDADPAYRTYRERAQKARVDAVTGQRLEAGQSIEVDHLVSRDEVTRRPGVSRLDPEVVAGILNREDNLVPMLAEANSSKGMRSFMTSAATDRQFWSNARNYYTDEQLAVMATREEAVRKDIFASLDAEVAKLPRP